MNILIVGKFYTEGFSLHIAETLESMGHSVYRFEHGFKQSQMDSVLQYRLKQVKTAIYDVYKKSKFHEKSVEISLMNHLRHNSIELIISCHDLLSPQQIKTIKQRHNLKICLWYPDHIGAFNKAMFLNANYDYLFFKDPYIVNVLENDLAKKSFYLPECCNPVYHNIFELSEDDIKKYSCDICTAGNLHPNRAELFKHLIEYDCKIWGNPPSRWMNIDPIKSMVQNKFVANEEKSKAFRGAKIVINNFQPAEILGANVRLFEVAAAGAFQLASWRAGIDQLYRENEEIVCYKSIPDLKNKINFYLKNSDERNRIAANAYRRTMKEHTYEHRLSLLLNTVNGNASGFKIS
ncbi:MAG: glycosyltransferase [Chitinophagaceae bacterium]